MVDKRNPLFLPKGSVRSILALGFAVAFIASALAQGEIQPDLAVLTATIVAFYFGTRSPVS